MSAPQILHKTLRFRPEGAGSSKTVKPTFTSTDDLGVILSITVNREMNEQLFKGPVNGTLVTLDAVNVEFGETINVTLAELSPLFWELVQSTAVNWSGGGGAYVPGSRATLRGWSQIVFTNSANQVINTVERWCKVDLNSVDFPQAAYVNPVITLRTLHSTLNSGLFQNVG